MSLQLQRERSHPCSLDRRVLPEELLDVLVGLLGEQRPRSAPCVIVEGGAPIPQEAGCDGVDGGARAEEGAGNFGGRMAIGGEQRDVHP
jgi:hypothetical protein